MSFAALAWAASQKTGGLASKSVLLALANYADEHGCAYPSIAAIAAFGEMDHRTAAAAIDRLVEIGLIADTGDKAGRTRQIKVYRLAVERPPKTRTLKTPIFAGKDPQKCGTDTIRDTVIVEASASPITRARKAKPNPFPKPEWADAQVWADFLDNRKRKRAANTATAYARFLSDIARLADDEWPPPRLLEHAAASGWAGIYNPRTNRHDRQPDPSKPDNLRGSRPNPAYDMYVQACADERAERSASQADQRDRPALPAIGAG